MSKIVSDLYRPLPETDEIRLLKLGHNQDEVIVGTLETHSLQHVPDFYALSYCWGKPKKNARVIIDGQSLDITQSLASALSRLSSLESGPQIASSRHIWIDQICVNQSDHGERRHQVTLMGPIYSKALRTLIWLGDDPEGAAKPAFALCEQIDSVYCNDHYIDPSGYENVHVAAYSDDILDKHGLPARSDSKWKALNQLLTNQWFQRLWVQQEAILSEEDPLLMFGSESCPFSNLAHASVWLAAKDFFWMNIIPKVATNVNSLFQNRQARQLGIEKDLSTLVQFAASSTHATDPRDKIFGLLGLAANGLERNVETGTRIRVDISAENTVNKTYRDATRHILLTRRNLAILAGPKLRTELLRDRYRSFGRQSKWPYAPSWVRSFDFGWHPGSPYAYEYVREEGSNRKLAVLDWGPYLTASKSMAAEIEHPTRNPNILRLRGILVDAIQHRGVTNTNVATGMQIFGPQNYLRMRDTPEVEGKYWQDLAHNYGLRDAGSFLARTLLNGRGPPSFLQVWERALKSCPDRSPRDLAEAILTVATRAVGPRGLMLTREELHDFFRWMHVRYAAMDFVQLRAKHLDAAVDFLRQWPPGENFKRDEFEFMLLACVGEMANLRRFFITHRGRLGLGPPAMGEGDCVAVLFGGGVPFVLRRHKEVWLLVGEAYVEGYMAGEGIDSWQDGQLEAQWFDIH